MKKRIPIILGLLLVIFAIWTLVSPSQSSFIARLDNISYDIQLRTRLFTAQPHPTNHVVIVDIDSKSLMSEGRWPWPRTKLAQLVDALHKEGAAVIAFDIFFPEAEKNAATLLLEKLAEKNAADSGLKILLEQKKILFDEDATFAQSITQSSSILAFSFLPTTQTSNELPPALIHLSLKESEQLDIIPAEGYVGNISILQKAAKVGGFINIFADDDGIIRHAPLIMKYNYGVYPALALQAVLSFLDEKITLVTPTYGDSAELEGIKIGNIIIPTDATGQVLIPFIGKSHTFPYFSATDILHQKIPKDSLLGKIVFVGTTAIGLGDLHSTAVQNHFPGIEIQATLVNGLLDHNFSQKPAWAFGANILFTLFFGILSAFLFPYLGPRTLGIIIILLPPGLLLLNSWIWTQTGFVLSLLMPALLLLMIALLNIIYGYLFETRRREKLKEMFGQYVPEKHIDEMLRTSGNYGLHGEDREMSVLFADIRNFTTISEGMDASELVTMLNAFFTPMTEIIFKNRGTIDKYVGDLVMAFWGAPLKDKYHTRHAIQTALDMRSKLKALKPILQEHQWPDIRIGIGINSGHMSVGDMGSRFRRNYTVMGDAVNLASRIEGLTKVYGVDIIVTETTQIDQPKFVFRQLDRVSVKGKKQGVSIYEVVGTKQELTPEIDEELVFYQTALAHYFDQRWEAAEKEMLSLHEKYPDRKLYLLYLERIRLFKNQPPPSDWDGVYHHTSK